MREIAAAKQAVSAASKKLGQNGGGKGNGRRRRRRAPDSVDYTRPYRQGMAAVTRKPWGSKGGKARPQDYFDANHPAHLPLPRAIGSYAVIRTTKLHRTTAAVIIIGATQTSDPTVGERPWWSPHVGIESANPGLPMNDPNNALPIQMTPIVDNAGNVQTGWEACELVPAAITVQVMFPSPVGTAGGVCRIGKFKTLSNLSNNSRTWNTFGDQFTAYNAPRLCAGGKLCLRGVTASCTPYDMSDLADFTPMRPLPNFAFTWSDVRAQHFAGFSPIVIFNELSTSEPPLVGQLDLLITVEWRVRFDPQNPAQASHKNYQPSSDAAWSKAVTAVESAGHGVADIVETVAEYGAYANAAAEVAGVLLL